MAEEGFMKADSTNLPHCNLLMITDFFAENECYNVPESRNVKALRSTRESYGDKAIGYVQVKREGNGKCVCRCRITPEHKVRIKPYSVTLIIDEDAEHIDDAQCNDCAASLGVCKHALAFIMWMHRRSEEPSPTSVLCYWKKARLSEVGSAIKYLKAKQFTNKKETTGKPLPSTSGFFEQVLEIGSEIKFNCPLLQYNIGLDGSKGMSLFKLLLSFYDNGAGGTDAEDFIAYCKTKVSEISIRMAAESTVQQSKNPLWHELRYGRVSASTIYEVAHCKTSGGSLVQTIFGSSFFYESQAMARGLRLEKHVLNIVSKREKTKFLREGFVVIAEHPVFGASPDAITADYVVEVKCPASAKAMSRYISEDGTLRPKFYAQVQLQMLALKKQKALFCVAAPDFEKSNDVSQYWVDFNMQYISQLIDTALLFWKTDIFSVMLDAAKK